MVHGARSAEAFVLLLLLAWLLYIACPAVFYSGVFLFGESGKSVLGGSFGLLEIRRP